MRPGKNISLEALHTVDLEGGACEPHLGVAGDHVQAIPVAAVHLPESEVKRHWVLVQATQRRRYKRRGCMQNIFSITI